MVERLIEKKTHRKVKNCIHMKLNFHKNYVTLLISTVCTLDLRLLYEQNF